MNKCEKSLVKVVQWHSHSVEPEPNNILAINFGLNGGVARITSLPGLLSGFEKHELNFA